MVRNVMRLLAVACVAGTFSATAVAGAKLTASSVTAQGNYNHSASLLTDGVIPGETTHWQSATNVWWTNQEGPGGVSFTFDYGNIYAIDDVLFSFDNNDAYRVDYSVDNSNWSFLTQVLAGDGEIGFGMDTGTSINNHPEFIANMDFQTPVNARYLRIYAIGGDNFYALAEFEAYGTDLNAVPEPSTLAMFGLCGVIGIAVRRRRRLV